MPTYNLNAHLDFKRSIQVSRPDTSTYRRMGCSERAIVGSRVGCAKMKTTASKMREWTGSLPKRNLPVWIRTLLPVWNPLQLYSFYVSFFSTRSTGSGTKLKKVTTTEKLWKRSLRTRFRVASSPVCPLLPRFWRNHVWWFLGEKMTDSNLTSSSPSYKKSNSRCSASGGW